MANMTFGVNLIPHNNTPTGSNTYSLGNSNYKWKLYADELNGEPIDTRAIPAGGTTGQVLTKASDTNYDTEWANASGGGGNTGDTMIIKFTYASNAWTCDHTFAEVYQALVTDQVPVIGVIVPSSASSSGRCVLHPTSVASTTIVLAGLSSYGTTQIYRQVFTYKSTGAITLASGVQASHTTSTSQLSNVGSPNSEWWDQYVLTHETYRDLNNPLLAWDPEGGSYSGERYPIVRITEDSDNGIWKMYWEGQWATGESGVSITFSTLADLYYFFCGNLSNYESYGGVYRTFPIIFHEYSDTNILRNGSYEGRAAIADYPSAAANSSNYGFSDAANGRIYWVTLDCVKANTYYDSNNNPTIAYSLIFTAKDVRDEDNALVLRTFILRGDGTEDVVAGVPIQIREAVLPTIPSPTYYSTT